MTTGYFATLDISRLGRMLRAGQVSAGELAERSLETIDAANPVLNAFVGVDAEGARRAAREADAELSRGVDRGPLHGIPVAIKDIIDVAGQPTTSGSALYLHRAATSDAACVEALRSAGAVIVGKTVLHEFAYGATGDRSVHGASRNPHAPDRISGGSSGGSAAAVASGMVPLALGTDTAGSVRVPAALCGIVGFKSAFDDIATDGVHPLAPSLDHVGVFARTVRDAALAHAALTGAREEPAADRAVVGWFPPSAIGPVDPGVDAQVRRTLRAAYPQVEEVAFDAGAGELFALFSTLQSSEASAVHADVIEPGSGLIDVEVLARLRKGAGIPAWRYLQAVERRSALAARIGALFERVDVLALPTVPTVATEVGVRTREIDGIGAEIRSALLSLTCPWNMTGDPALTIPAGTVDGLPVGLQLVAARGREGALFAVAETIERTA